MKAEIIHVKFKASVLADSDELMNLVHISRYPKRSHPHDLVFSLVDLEAQESGEGAVKKPKRMGEAYFLMQFYICALSYPEACGCPFPYTIDSEYVRFLEWGTQECAGSMGEMVLAEENFLRGNTKPFLDEMLDPELVA